MTKRGFKFSIALLLAVICVNACQKDEEIIIPTVVDKEVSLDSLLYTSVVLHYNPYKIAPLSAEAVLTLKEACAVTITVSSDKKENPIPIVHDTNLVANTKILLPVLGFYADIENQVSIKLTNSAGNYAIFDTVIKTEALGVDVPRIEMNTIQADRMGNKKGLNFADFFTYSPGPTFYPFYFDNNGDIRWILTNGLAQGSRKLKNGSYGTFYTNTTKREFIEYTMVGKEANRISLDGYHYDHDFTELPNGNLLILCSKDASAPKIEDHIIIVDRISGMVLKEYNLADVLDDQRLLGYHLDEANDWFHHNSVYYCQHDNSMILSGRHQGIVKVGVGDGKLKWILAPHKAWGVNKPELPNYLLKAVDASGNPYANNIQEGDEKTNSFDWTWGQHNVILTKTGNLLCFDNGTHRNFLGGAFNLGYDPNSYSRIVEYEFDEVNKTVRQVWQYGADKPEYLSGAISGVQELDNGNRLMCPGAIGLSDGSFIAKVIELNPTTNEKVFECTYYLKGAVWNQGVYRSKRERLY